MAEEIKNQGQQENAENLNENVSGQAKEIISAALEETQNRETSPVLKADSNVTDKFKGLPMRELIAAPLIAAAEAQQELAATAWNFLHIIEFIFIYTSKLHLMVKAAIKRVYWNSMSKDRYSRMEK